MREIITPIGEAKVILKDFITGRDARVLREALIKSAKIDPEGRGVNAIDTAALDASDDEKIKIVVISVNDETEGIVNTILDMASKDYDFVMEEIEKVTSGIEEKKSD